MKTKVLQVFYGADALPYKDKERTVHFPIVGNAIQNANNTAQIKFYFDRLIEENEQTTFVAVSKLPNGKIGSKILETYDDEELGEQYALLDLDSFYTQYKGDVFISLQGYQGGVRVEQDEQGIYQIYGTPVIAATGSIKLSINYAPSFVGSGETENVTLQQVLGELSTKLGVRQETLHAEELPTVGNPDVWYVVNDDEDDPNKQNIYIWNATTQSYIWVGDNTLNLGDYYTQEQGEQFENNVSEDIATFKEQVENEIESVASGSPKGVYATLSDLETAYPTGTTGIYVVSANGHWYYWNGSAWADGGVYQATSVSESDTVIESLRYDIDSDTDIRNISDHKVFNGYFEIGAFSMVAASYTRTVYAQVPVGASKATVSKTIGKLFRVGFSVNEPNEQGVQIINEQGTYIDAGQVASVTVKVPSSAKYIVCVIWNANTDAGTTSDTDMIASTQIIMRVGAKDYVARNENEELKALLNDIPPQNIKHITRTGHNYLDDAIVKEVGNYWNGATIGQPISLGTNANYSAVKIKAEAFVYEFTPVRYVHALDSNQNLLQVLTTDGISSFDNTILNAAYLCLTFHANTLDTGFIKKQGTTSVEQFTVKKQWVFEDLVMNTIDEKQVHLPSKIYCGVGRTIELYNEQVFLNYKKFHLQWECNVGVAYARKFSVTGDLSNVGSHILTLRIYDDSYNILIEKSTTLIIAQPSITNTINILAIGDSLTNGKEWLSEVPTLSNNKINYIGTRRLSGVNSEGRSGATTTWYITNSSYTYQDGSTYQGNPNISGSSNPFWDGTKFSLQHYITNQAAYVGTPDAVQIMLGTNDLKQTATVVANIKTMVDTIHIEYPSMKVFICSPIFHSNQNGYYSTGGEGYIGVFSNWQYELDLYTIALMNKLEEQFNNNDYSSFVTIVPTATCMDREYDFGQIPTPVNPRLQNVTINIPSQYTHPQSAGYLQMADVMYSAYCAKLG